MKLIPIAGTGNRIFIKASKEEVTTSSGIILAADTEKAPTEGVVLAVSEFDSNGVKPNVKEGDYVYFPENAPVPLTIEGQEYLVLKESSVYAKRG